MVGCARGEIDVLFIGDVSGIRWNQSLIMFVILCIFDIYI